MKGQISSKEMWYVSLFIIKLFPRSHDNTYHVRACLQMGESPLIRAAHNGHMQTVKFLVEQGANVNALDMGDNSALHWAAMRGHVEIVKFLTEQGADKTLRNKQEKLPIDLCQSCWSDAYRFTRQVLA